MDTTGPAFIQHVKRSITTAPDGRTRALRLLILALAEAGPEIKPISQKGDDTMRNGVLFDNRKQYPVEVAVKMALAVFNQASHVAGLQAREVRFHPDEVPEAAEIHGLTVYTDKLVPRRHIRVTAVDDGQGMADEELARAA